MDDKRIIVAASAAERDYFYFADASEAAWRVNPFEPDQVYRIYDSHYPGQWHITPVDRCIVSICRCTYPDQDRTIFVTLSAEGEVGFVGKREGFTEKIPGAGLYADDAKGYGYMRANRQIGKDLFACGHNGQVYTRTRPGGWQHVDAGLLLPVESNDVSLKVPIRSGSAVATAPCSEATNVKASWISLALRATRRFCRSRDMAITSTWVTMAVFRSTTGTELNS